ncbi:hypothetical protein [Nocardiopsis sp. CNT312]|uniref:hypothetical protein n=1 Tax=Nocardiopsis sp. CNT312 TaxID=1137268 RepID=UPI00048ABF2C|nr:hypothetical protein [Nocardiopsis sp. CNT312]
MPHALFPTADLVDPWLELLADLGAESLPGESEDERAARADILDDLLQDRAIDHLPLASPLAEHPGGVRSGVEQAASTIAALVDAYGERIAALADTAA